MGTMDAPPESDAELRQQEARRLTQHALLLILALVITALGVVLRARPGAAGTIVLVSAAACWIGSGTCAVAARRHAFGRISGGGVWGTARMSSSKRDPTGAAIVGGLLVAIGAAVAVWGVVGPASP